MDGRDSTYSTRLTRSKNKTDASTCWLTVDWLTMTGVLLPMPLVLDVCVGAIHQVGGLDNSKAPMPCPHEDHRHSTPPEYIANNHIAAGRYIFSHVPSYCHSLHNDSHFHQSTQRWRSQASDDNDDAVSPWRWSPRRQFGRQHQNVGIGTQWPVRCRCHWWW